MTTSVANTSPAQSKIALFRSLFQGREDVYPIRFESQKAGRSGYSPACANEWVRRLCEKPRIKCAACPHRKSMPVTDEVIRRHLSGSMKTIIRYFSPGKADLDHGDNCGACSLASLLAHSALNRIVF